LFYQAEKYHRLQAAKLHTFPIIQHYAIADCDKYHKYAERILNCSNELKLRVMTDPDDLLISQTSIENARWCRVRQCPMCQFARVSKQRARFFKAFGAMSLPDNFVFLTLTVRNRPLKQLRQSLFEMTQAWDKFSRRPTFPVQGWLRSMEVTLQRDRSVGKNCGVAVRSIDGDLMCHPHFHILMQMEDDYFVKAIKSKDWWIDGWQSALSVDYRPSISIRKIRAVEGGDFGKAVLETLKYTVKPGDFGDFPESAEWLYGITEQLHRLRALRLGGSFSKLCSQKELDKIDDECTCEHEISQAGSLLILKWNHVKGFWNVDESAKSLEN
jgi:hypothetical protein